MWWTPMAKVSFRTQSTAKILQFIQTGYTLVYLWEAKWDLVEAFTPLHLNFCSIAHLYTNGLEFFLEHLVTFSAGSIS